MEIEHVARVGFTTRRTSKEQGDFSVCGGLFRQIVIDCEGVPTVVAEVFAHSRPRIGSKKLHRSRIRSSGLNDNRVVHGSEVLERFHNLRYRGCLLTDCDVDADYVLPLLIYDCVNCNCCLTCLPIADYQFPLAATDRDHRINRFKASLERFLHRLPIDNAGCNALDWIVSVCEDWTTIINRVSKYVYDSAHESVAHRNLHDSARSLYKIAFSYDLKVTKQNRPHLVLFQIQSQTSDVVRKLQEFACHHFLESMDFGDAIPNLDNRAHFRNRNPRLETFNLLANNLVDFAGSNSFHDLLYALQAPGLLSFRLVPLQADRAGFARIRQIRLSRYESRCR